MGISRYYSANAYAQKKLQMISQRAGAGVAPTNQCRVRITKNSLPQAPQQLTEDVTSPAYSPSQEGEQVSFGMQDIEVYLCTAGDAEPKDKQMQLAQLRACRFSLNEDSISLSLDYPFIPGSLLKIVQLPQLIVADETPSIGEQGDKPLLEAQTSMKQEITEIMNIELECVKFIDNQATLQSQQQMLNMGKQLVIPQIEVSLEIDNDTPSILSEIASPSDEVNKQADEVHYKFDFSATNLPLKAKRFSFFKGGPLLSFYELSSPNPSTGKPHVLFESDVSKMATTDPFWTLTHPIPKSLVDPQFTISVFQSSDSEKTKRALVCAVTIELESIIGPEKETMFEVPGTSGKTIIMLDRIQEVVPTQQDKSDTPANQAQI